MPEEILTEFSFNSVTVDARGEIIAQTERTARQLTEMLPGGVALELVALPGGSFQMGSGPGHGFPDETPRHLVRIEPFFLGKTTVTQAQWRAVMGSLPPCRTSGEENPVDRVSWTDAVAFCTRLAQTTRRAYRLPGEAEWEYACRAGTLTPFSCGETLTTNLANYVGLHTFRDEPPGVYRHVSLPVGSLPPNPFGLYEMHGNVWEWVADRWHESYDGAPADGRAWVTGDAPQRILRGGCWHDPPDLCRCAARLRSLPGEGEDYVGFRIALTSTERIEPGRSQRFWQRLRERVMRVFSP